MRVGCDENCGTQYLEHQFEERREILHIVDIAHAKRQCTTDEQRVGRQDSVSQSLNGCINKRQHNADEKHRSSDDWLCLRRKPFASVVFLLRKMYFPMFEKKIIANNADSQ